MSAWWRAVVVAEGTLLLVLAVVVLGLLRRVSGLLEAAEAQLGAVSAPQAPGLPPGTSLPAFAAHDTGGAPVRSDALAAAAAVYLFVSAGCEPCLPLLDALAGLADPLGGVRLVVVADRPSATHPAAARIDGVVLRDDNGEVADAFRATARPSAFAVAAGGLVADARIVNTVAQLRDLAARVGGRTRGGMLR